MNQVGVTTVTTRVPPSGSAAYVLDAPSLPPLLQLSLPELAKGSLMELNLSRIGEQTSFPVPVSDEYPGIDELNGVAIDDGTKEPKDGQEGTAAAAAASSSSVSVATATPAATRAPAPRSPSTPKSPTAAALSTRTPRTPKTPKSPKPVPKPPL